MAHEVLPQHRPHEQLRTEAPTRRKHTDKYVSAYVSSDNFVDMSFSNPLLQESADHFRVGIDELTVNLAHLSLLEYDSAGTNVLFRIKRLGYFGDDNDPQIEKADRLLSLQEHNGLGSAALANALEFKISRQYNTIAEIMERMKEICQALASSVEKSGLINPDPDNYDIDDIDTYQLWNVPLSVDQADGIRPRTFFNIFLTPGGLLKFQGHKIFWSNFVIEIPEAKYRYLLLGDSTRRFISLHPETGALVDQYTGALGYVNEFDDWDTYDPQQYHTQRVFRTFTGDMNIANSLDRRVALEVGCSLPLKNSPMFDHGAEAPDFVLGRFHLAQGITGDALFDSGGPIEMQLNVPEIGAKQLQGPKDRICYHHLGPQQKIQTLRLRLWARVRTYDAANDMWGMKTIQMPVRGSDFWHIKLHFLSKSS